MKAKEIREILKGIDKDEFESDDGWWETSVGADFGKKKLNELIAKIKEWDKEIIDIIPTNWTDPFLSGTDSPLGEPPYGCPEVEGLLLALKNRIITAQNK